MSYILKMPAAGEGITEGEIVKWLVEAGDNVSEDQILAEVQNDKLVQEIHSPVVGVMKKIIVEEGSVAQVGEALAEIDAEGYEASEEETTEEVTTKTKEADSTATTSTSSTYTVELPPAGEGIMEGELSEWLVKEGDMINVDETILMVQNDKLLQDVPSPVSGKVLKILVEEGSVANVGDAIMEVEVEGEVAEERTSEPAAKVETTQAPKTTTAPSASQVANRVLAMPSVRQYARDLNIDITKVSGTGKHNHITKADIDAYSEAPAVESAPETVTETTEKTQTVTKERTPQAIPQSDNTTREKMTPVRRAIANAMVQSKEQAPHVTLFDEIEVSKLMAHRSKFKDVAAESDIKLTFLAYMAKAVITVLRKYPILNASVDDANNEIVYKHYYNLGIAVDTDAGLYVPVIKDANTKGIFTIAEEIVELANKAHENKLSMDEMSNGSTTISNIGSAWGGWFTPIINYPEVAIFGMGRIEKKPVVLEDDTLGIGQVLHLSLSFDHRIVDGLTAQLAMNELKRLIADPELLLMEG